MDDQKQQPDDGGPVHQDVSIATSLSCDEATAMTLAVKDLVKKADEVGGFDDHGAFGGDVSGNVLAQPTDSEHLAREDRNGAGGVDDHFGRTSSLTIGTHIDSSVALESEPSSLMEPLTKGSEEILEEATSSVVAPSSNFGDGDNLPSTDDQQIECSKTANSSETETFSGTAKVWLPAGMSPQRPSTLSRVSSLGSSAMNYFEGTSEYLETVGVLNTSELDDEEDGTDRTTPFFLFGSKPTGAYRNDGAILGEISLSQALMNADDKSIRSESTRPDPPSIIDGQSPRNDVASDSAMDGMTKEWDEDGDVVAMDVPDTIEEKQSEQTAHTGSDVVANGQTLHIHEAGFSQELIGSGTLGDHTDDEFLAKPATSWDLDHDALLSSTPDVETKFMMTSTSPLDTSAIPEAPKIFETVYPGTQDGEEGVANVSRGLVGPDNLVVLPRVDEHRFYDLQVAPTTVSPTHVPMQMMHAHHPLSLPSSVPFGNLHVQHPGSFNYVQSIHQQQPPLMMHMTANGGRRKIRLRLQEEVRNSNNSIKRHFRSGSLLGTLRKSSKRMLRFGGSFSATSIDLSDDQEPARELYKTVDRGTLTVSWYEGTSSLELQQHVRKSVVRKLKLDNSSVELDDFRVLDDTVDPPEG
jgi:hypothetical protein